MLKKSILTILTTFSINAIIGCATVYVERKQPEPIICQENNENKILNEYVGAIHVHSNKSHDSKGSLERIIHCAKKTKLDFVIITDHNTMIQKSKEKNYEGIEIIVGQEVSTQYGHLLIFGNEKDYSHNPNIQYVIDEVKKENGATILAHPLDKKTPWKNFDLENYTGIEHYNLGNDLWDEESIIKILTLMPIGLLSKKEFNALLMNEQKKYLKLFDNTKEIVGIAGNDAHELKYLGLTILPFEFNFQAVRTHVFARSNTKTDLIDAIKKGRCYTGFDCFADSSGFNFYARNKAKTAIMGQEIDWKEKETILWTEIPSEGIVSFFKNGQCIYSKKGKGTIGMPAFQPGEYRIVVYKDNFLFSGKKPWIISNKIMVK